MKQGDKGEGIAYREFAESGDYFRSAADFYVTERNPVDRPVTIADDVDVNGRGTGDGDAIRVPTSARGPGSSPT